MVERMLSMHEAQGSIPCFSTFFFLHRNSQQQRKKNMRGPGIEPGSTAWKATMLTITPATLLLFQQILDGAIGSAPGC